MFALVMTLTPVSIWAGTFSPFEAASAVFTASPRKRVDVVKIGQRGVAEMLRPHFQEIQARMKNWCVNARHDEIALVPAHYGENSGIAGGAALCCIERK